MKKTYKPPKITSEVYYSAPLLAVSPPKIIIGEGDGDQNLAKPVRGSRTIFLEEWPTSDSPEGENE